MPDEEKDIYGMNLGSYPSNSIKSREEGKPTDISPTKRKKSTEPIEVKKKKKSFGTRFKEAFIGQSVGSVTDYVLWEVIVPYVKKLLAESANTAINLALFGDAKPRWKNSDRPHTSMAAVYNDRNSANNRRRTRHNRPDVQDFLFPSEEQANRVLEMLMEEIADYEVVSLADFYSEVNEPVVPVDSKWGWKSLDGADVSEIPGEGWVLDLPPAKPID